MKNLSYTLVIFMFAICLSSGAAAQNKSEKKSKDDSAKIVRKLVGEGSALFLKGDYESAIKPYQKALNSEDKNPTLEKPIWRVLVDNLGMAYGISGDLKKAKTTFEYGLSKDPDYAMFHYNMACTYAEMNDEDNAIAYLKSAFKNKENMIAGEVIPDPSSDSSFERFMKDKKFLNALKEINRQ